ncbi:cupredoxin family protein [Janthinobacterium sp. 17J80-10]|uniref:cupredoxin domain-containing protein n=1 Tax=Janthinobacterium sp. 17J80-10 TaxID=2497863 RepID=UPI001F50ADAF|nr:cupredoxin family protein [Janthinobacterium sp. 17J80-10]
MILSVAIAAAAPAAWAGAGASDANHDAAEPISNEKHAFGKQGDPKKADRTITIAMNDKMRFVPGDIKVRQGETIRFVVRNKGKVLHEMVIGTMDELQSHHEMMKQHPGMEHDEAFMTHVAAGKKGEMVWQFTEAGEFYYACLIPGHFEAGMVGKITVTKG